MNYIAIWVVVWLLNGHPVSLSGILEPGVQCSTETARDIVDASTRQSGARYQDPIMFWCDSIASMPPLVPKDAAT